jgi:hypothetical protein
VGRTPRKTEKKRKPPKRIEKKDGIPLNESENKRYWSFLDEVELSDVVRRYEKQAGVYIRGRRDGKRRSGAEPCGYVFVDKGSFDLCHRPIAFVDAHPMERPVRVSFRAWNGFLPFHAKDWRGLDPDRMQKKMRTVNLVPSGSFRRAVTLTRTAKRLLIAEFDLTVDCNAK